MTVEPKLLPLRIRLPYATEEEFIQKYGANVARGGLFIPTRVPKSVGTGLSFELVLAQGGRLLRGEGVVVKAQTDGARAGMTVRFVRLDAHSKALIDRIVTARGQAPARAPPPPESPPPEPPAKPATAPGKRTRPVISTEALRKQAALSAQLPARRRETPAGDTHPVPPEQPPTPEQAPDPIANAILEHLPSEEEAPATLAAAPEPPAPEVPAPVPVPTEAREAPSLPERTGRRRALLDVPVTPPVTVAPPEVVLGIDLGTSRARAALHHQGRLQLLALGEATALPSLVAVDEMGQLLVGAEARAEAERAPRHALTGLRRLLGLRARSPLLHALAGPLPFPIVPGPHGDAHLELRGRELTLPELSARLLRELKGAASTFLGHEVTRAVLCVPAHFDDRQRAAMREAGRLAGFNVLRLLNAPSAAALAFGHERGLARKRLLVVDLGGGSLDVSVVQLTGDDLEVITTGGDPTLGGMDFDARLAEALAEDLLERGQPRPEHPLDWVPLLAAAEAAKVALDEHEEVSVPLAGQPPLSLGRERLESLTADLVQRITLVVRQVLESSALTPQGLDEVLLLGGQGRAPQVRRALEESLGVPVRVDVEDTGSAALGAALLGRGLLDAAAGKPGATVSEVLSVPIGLAERGGTFRRVFERNTRLPTEKTLVLPVTPGPLALALFQGPSQVALENEYLGALDFSIERPGEAEVHFSVSVDGTLSLAATLPGGRRQPVTLAAHMPEEAELESLIARSPFEGEPEARPGGLLSGLRKLFGRR